MRKGNVVAAALAIALASAAIYGKTAGFELLPSWDDGDTVLGNPDVRDLSAAGVVRTFSRTTAVLYQPLTTLSFAVDHALWGLSPAAFHLGNVVLHAAAAFVLFLLVRALSASGLVAAIAAGLFLVHPVNVENVAWVTERKTILSGLLFFGAVLAWVRARERGARVPWAWPAVLGAAAMLAKPTAVVLPLAIAAYERWLRPDPRVRLALPLVPVAAAAAVPTVWAHLAGSIPAESLAPATLAGTVWPTAVVVWWKYVRLLAWPSELSAFYDTALHGWLDPAVVAAVAAWAALAALVFTRGSREVRFWFAWFWICLLPTSNLLPLNTYYNDCYLYAPGVAAFVLAGLAVRRAREALRARGHPRAAAVPVALAAAVAVAAGVAASRRAEVWRDEVALWEDAVRRSPRLYTPRLNLGFAYDVRGRWDDAERQYLEAARILPTPEAVQNLVMVRTKRAMAAGRAGGAAGR